MRLIPHLCTAALVGLICLSSSLSGAAAATPAHDQPARTMLNNTTGAPVSGSTPVPPGTELYFGLVLTSGRDKMLDSRVRSVSDPASTGYAHYIAAGRYAASFGLRPSERSASERWLVDQGFVIRGRIAGDLYLELRGSAAQIEKAFAVNLVYVQNEGFTVLHIEGIASLPATAPLVLRKQTVGLLGLDELHNNFRYDNEPASPRASGSDDRYAPGPPDLNGIQPCSASFGSKLASTLPESEGSAVPYAVCGYGPAQFQTAYGVTPYLRAGASGRGITVATIVDHDSPTMPADADRYSRQHHQPTFTPGQYTQVLDTPFDDDAPDNDLCDPGSEYVEQTLDVEAIHSVAPGAKIVYLGARDCLLGLPEALAETVDQHRADVVNNSWSDSVEDPTYIDAPLRALFRIIGTEAALTGVTVTFSSGDSGDRTNGGTMPQDATAAFPADDPYVTGVGGTSLALDAQGRRRFEYGWESTYAPLDGKTWGAPIFGGGSGGGTSKIFAQPFYQRGVVPNSLATRNGSTPQRVVPDIALDADTNTGLRAGETFTFPDGSLRYTEYRVGGTSLSSPLFAGLVALSSQLAGHPLGFVNPALYDLAGTSAIHDVAAPKTPPQQVRADYTNGENAAGGLTYRLQTIDGATSTLHDTPGYDNETGLGSPGGPQFYAALAALTRRS